MSKKRYYQADFYASFEAVRNRARRISRANKIGWALEQHVPRDLSRAVCVDVGCSAGVITAQLASRFGAMVGIDYDRTGLMAIHPHDKLNASFVRGDALRLPFADESVDFIICVQIYEHVPDDVPMVEEIYRILRPGGYCFFSGPNWLFPLEPHYWLPFLHWLPEAWADRYLSLSGRGTHYYERSRTMWSLRRLLRRFEIEDLTIETLCEYYLARCQGSLTFVLRFIPISVWRLVLPLFPNFNWLLRKPRP
jgi:SAM-dependent methyltransferase